MSTLKSLANISTLFHVIMFIISILFISSSYSNGNVNFGSVNYNLSFTIVTMVVSLIAIGITVSLVGINFMGSGLNDTSTSLVVRLVILGCFWVILSSVTFPIFMMYAIIGIPLYTILSILFAFNLFVGSEEQS